MDSNRKNAIPINVEAKNTETWRILNISPIVKQTRSTANNRLLRRVKLIDFIRDFLADLKT